MAVSLREKIRIAQSLLTSAAILVGGLWGMNEYLEKKTQDRISKSFEIIAEMRASKDFKQYGKFVVSTAVNAILNDKDLKGAAKTQALTKLHTEAIKDQFNNIVELYENAVICVSVKHCDKHVIAAFMAQDAHSIFVIGNGVIEEQSELRNDNTYASELLEVRGWYCTLPQEGEHRLKQVSWC